MAKRSAKQNFKDPK